MLADYHTHTYYSDDSECPMEDMVKKAVAIGLDAAMRRISRKWRDLRRGTGTGSP